MCRPVSARTVRWRQAELETRAPQHCRSPARIDVEGLTVRVLTTNHNAAGLERHGAEQRAHSVVDALRVRQL